MSILPSIRRSPEAARSRRGHLVAWSVPLAVCLVAAVGTFLSPGVHWTLSDHLFAAVALGTTMEGLLWAHRRWGSEAPAHLVSWGLSVLAMAGGGARAAVGLTGEPAGVLEPEAIGLLCLGIGGTAGSRGTPRGLARTHVVLAAVAALLAVAASPVFGAWSVAWAASAIEFTQVPREQRRLTSM
jgi:hypothetical protein